jgi:hypothetical protein
LESLKGGDHSGDRLRGENNIKMDLREIGFRNVDWIHLAQDRDRWLALVSTVMSIQFHKRRIILLAERTISSGPYS